MVSLLLSIVMAWPVAFPGGQTITLSLPDTDPDAISTYFRPRTVFNPQHSFAAVSSCGTAGTNLDWCEFFLVDPHLGSRPLPQGQLGGLPALKWTPDGQYLIAVGDNSVRLWNLRGGVRGIVPEVAVTPPERRLFRSIKGLDFRGHLLCLRTEFGLGVPVYPTPGASGLIVSPAPSQFHRVAVQQAYRWPALQRGTPVDDRRCQSK